MLGQPVSMLIPDVVGVKLHGKLREGITATDLVLHVTQMLRAKGVVGKFVEFYGKGLANLTVSDRTTIANMSPEYGSTVAIFPIDDQTLAYLRLTGRSAEQIALVEAYAKAQGLFRTEDSPDPRYSTTLELDLSVDRAEPRGPAPPAGSRPALERQAGVPRRARRMAGRPRGEIAGRRARAPRRRWGRPDGRRRPSGDRSLRRRRRDRGDHLVHEHVESGGARRRGAARQARGREGPRAQAVGEDLPCTRLESRHGLPSGRRARYVSRRTRLQSRRVRLHDVHREQRAAPRGSRASGRGTRFDRRRRALGEPEFRRPHPSSGARELSRLAAARRRLRARGAHGYRSHLRAARLRPGRRAGHARRYLADERGDRNDGRRLRHRDDVPFALRRRVRGRRTLARARRAERRTVRLGRELRIRQARSVFRRHAGRAGRAR